MKSRLITPAIMIMMIFLVIIPVKNNDILPGDLITPSIKGTTAYVERGPIEILNDSAFDLYGFAGSGTPSEPYLIEGYNITSNTDTLITIAGTTMHFKIKDCILNCLGSASYLAIEVMSSGSGTIENNTILNSTHPNGIISIISSGNVTMLDNTIGNCGVGIMSFMGDSSTIRNNNIYNAVVGTVIAYTDGNFLINNTVHDCNVGMLFGITNGNTLANNTVYNITGGFNPEPGVNINAGIYLDEYSSYNILTNNTIFDCNYEGIYLNGSSNDNDITNNTIDNCDDGIHLSYANNNNLFNNFIKSTDLILTILRFLGRVFSSSTS